MRMEKKARKSVKEVFDSLDLSFDQMKELYTAFCLDVQDNEQRMKRTIEWRDLLKKEIDKRDAEKRKHIDGLINSDL